MKLNRILLMVPVLFLAVGCSSLTPQLENITRPETPANLVVKCPPLEEIDTTANLGTLMEYTTNLMTQYNQCAIRNDKLIEVSK